MGAIFLINFTRREEYERRNCEIIHRHIVTEKFGKENALCNVLGISLQQAADAFGEYWVCKFAPKTYPFYYKGINSAKEFLLNMDKVHELTTKNISGAMSPRFNYEWKDNKTLIMTYK